MLFDILEDPSETKDLAAAKPDVVKSLAATAEQWRASCKRSLEGADYRKAD